MKKSSPLREQIAATRKAAVLTKAELAARKAAARKTAEEAARKAVGPGLTQAELAARVGMDQSNISAIERGAYVPKSVDVLSRLASALGKRLVVDGDGPRLVDPD